MADEPKTPVIIKAFPKRKEYRHAEERFLRTLGLCVSQWAFVDRQLFMLFRLMLGAATHRAAAIYYTPKTLNQRVQFVDKLFEQNLQPDQYKDYWKPLLKKLDTLIPVRNIFVHHPTRRLHTAREGRAVYEYAIHFEENESRITKLPKALGEKGYLDIDDLRRHALAVDELHDALEALRRKLKGLA
jgi:hypothetical protein